jgi:hypothetical protein
MKKLIIQTEVISDYKILAITTTQRKDYAFASLLNKKLNISLEKQKDFSFHDGEEIRDFSLYKTNLKEEALNIILLGAKDGIIPLVAKAKQMDFFILFEKRMPDYIFKEVSDVLRGASQIQYVGNLPSKTEKEFNPILVDLELQISEK